MNTQHTHQSNFGRKVAGCPRCTELANGAPVRAWRNYRAESDAQRVREIRAHDCKRSGCGPVCTFGDW